MWPAIILGLRSIGVASIGYFVNDIGDGLARVTNVKNETIRKPDGSFKWWYVLLVFTLAFVALYFAFNLLKKFTNVKK